MLRKMYIAYRIDDIINAYDMGKINVKSYNQQERYSLDFLRNKIGLMS